MHGPFVEPHSGYLKAYLANKQMSSSSRFVQQLSALPCPDAFSAVVEWMYTQRKEALSRSRVFFAVYQVAAYLDMTSSFLDLLHDALASEWKSSLDESLFLEDALEAQCVPLEALRRVISDVAQSGTPVQGDFLLRVIMHWSRQVQQVQARDVPLLQEMLSSEMHRCSVSGMKQSQACTPEAFDLLVSASALLKLTDIIVKSWKFNVSCRTCSKQFVSSAELEANPCKRACRRHSGSTFESKKGNVCCKGCNRPLDCEGCVVEFQNCEHTLETLDGQYALQKRPRTG